MITTGPKPKSKSPLPKDLKKKLLPIIIIAVAVATIIYFGIAPPSKDTTPESASSPEPLQIESAIIDAYRDYPFRFDESLLEQAGFKVKRRLLPETSTIYGKRYFLPKEYFEIEPASPSELLDSDNQVVTNRRIVGIKANKQGADSPPKNQAEIDEIFEKGSLENNQFDYVKTLVDGRTKVEITHNGYIVAVTGWGKPRVKALLQLVLNTLN